MIERIFNDRYRLDGPLGRGGMATVYAGTDTVLRRRVAVKVLRGELAADGDFVERFYSEAQHAAKLAHPNIVNVYDVGRSGDEYFIVMEYVDGTTLAEMIETDGGLPEPVAIDFAAQICNGLAYAHRSELLHRDIKPANILVTKDDVVKISDFGIARAVSASAAGLTAPGMVMGSVYYLSPEQAQGLELTPASDLYSLGIVIYQMLTGKLPYTGETPVTVALKHVSHPVPSIESDDPSISPALAAIVRKLLQKEPGHRFRSASEVAAALREARERPLQVAGASAVAAGGDAVPGNDPETPPPRRVRRESGRAPAGTPAAAPAPIFAKPALLAGLAAAFVLALFAGYWFTVRTAERRPVANVEGMTIDEARTALSETGHAVRVTERGSESVAPGLVLGQEPAAGSPITRDAPVDLVVSSGMPNVDLGDLRHFSRDDAQRLLSDQHLSAKINEKYDPAPKGSVIAQDPAPGSRAPLHSIVTLTVSRGPQPVAVPDVIGMRYAAAADALRAAKLTVDVIERSASSSIAPDTVISQEPKAGSPVGSGSPVSLVVTSGQATAAVPDVTTQTIGDATRSLTALGFVPAIVYIVQAGRSAGVVVDQKPGGGSRTEKGASVSLTVAVSGKVPDVAGLPLDQARRTLSDAGYRIGNVAYTQKGSEGAVAYTEPAAGSPLRPDEAVTIYYNSPGVSTPSR